MTSHPGGGNDASARELRRRNILGMLRVYRNEGKKEHPMIALAPTTTTTIDEFISANWSHDESTRAFWLGELNYRNRLRWANVMPAVVKAMPALWEHRFGADWTAYTARFPYFELAQLENVFHAVMGGTHESSEYAIDQLFGPEAAHIVRPMLSTMWKRYVV